MQLAKQKIRRAKTFNEDSKSPDFAPKGVRRQDEDYDQKNNTQQRNRNAKGDSFNTK